MLLPGGMALARPSNGDTEKKLRELFLTKVKIETVTLREAVRELQDQIQAAGAGKDVILRITPSATREESTVHLSFSLDLRDIQLESALKKICDTASTTYKVEDGEVVILPVHSTGQSPPPQGTPPAWTSKLDLVIPSLEWSELRPNDVVVRLRQISEELDPVKPGGISFVLRQPLPDPEVRTSLTLKKVTIRAALDAYVKKAGLKWTATETGVVISP